MDHLTSVALFLLREAPQQYLQDARQYAHIGNSIVGSFLSLKYGAPSRNAQAAVVAALAIIDEEGEGKTCL